MKWLKHIRTGEHMTNEHALAIAKNELAYYRQVKKDGITIRDWLEFWEIVVAALENMRGDSND